jgi:hypothetical protein
MLLCCLVSLATSALLSSCESGGWVEGDESLGIYPDLDNNHLYQLILWEKYYSFKPFLGHSSGGRKFRRGYYLVDYTLGGKNARYKTYLLADTRKRLDEQRLVDSFCAGRAEYLAFLRAYERQHTDVTPPLDSQLVRMKDSLAKRQFHLWGVCGATAILRNDDVVGKTNDTLLFYEMQQGRPSWKKLTVDSSYRVFEIIQQGDSCIVVLRDRKADSLIFYTVAEQKAGVSLSGPYRHFDISAIPDTIKLDEYGHLNIHYYFTLSPGNFQLLWLSQDDTPSINPEWMLYGFDRIWYLSNGKMNCYHIPYRELSKKLAKLR